MFYQFWDLDDHISKTGAPGMLGEDIVDINVLTVTKDDRLSSFLSNETLEIIVIDDSSSLGPDSTEEKEIGSAKIPL